TALDPSVAEPLTALDPSVFRAAAVLAPPRSRDEANRCAAGFSGVTPIYARRSVENPIYRYR
ncbi:MAG: hypothetical protein ACI944_002684, partial [Natronomonas sp.]